MPNDEEKGRNGAAQSGVPGARTRIRANGSRFRATRNEGASRNGCTETRQIVVVSAVNARRRLRETVPSSPVVIVPSGLRETGRSSPDVIAPLHLRETARLARKASGRFDHGLTGRPNHTGSDPIDQANARFVLARTGNPLAPGRTGRVRTGRVRIGRARIGRAKTGRRARVNGRHFVGAERSGRNQTGIGFAGAHHVENHEVRAAVGAVVEAEAAADLEAAAETVGAEVAVVAIAAVADDRPCRAL